MVKIVKKKRKIRFEGIVSILCFILCITAFLSVTVLRAHNVVLANQEKALEGENEILQNDVSNLKLDVKKLDDKNRILAIAKDAGLKQNQEQIVSIKND